jgi:hypothetical protein
MARTRPSSAPESSSREHGKLGAAGLLDVALPGAPAPLGLGVPDRRAQGKALEDDREPEDGEHDRRRGDLVRVGDLVVALVDREQPADREEHDRDDEGPEVPQASVAELVQRGGIAPRAPASQHQQALVRGVGDGVDRLGQQRRGARDEEPDETW